MWLCWFTPGIATGLSMAAYFEWFSKLEAAWFPIALLGLIAAVLLGCASFAACIHAGKAGREQFGRRVLGLALPFILTQIFVAPLIGLLVAYLIYGRNY
jgi:hypothetical protein